MLEELINLLGKNNVKRLEDGITDIILNQIKIDLSEHSEERILLDPDEIEEFAESCKEKAFKNIESEVIKKMEEKMKKSLLGKE